MNKGSVPFILYPPFGSVRIKVPNQTEEELVYVSGGILEVQPHVVTILSDSAFVVPTWTKPRRLKPCVRQKRQ